MRTQTAVLFTITLLVVSVSGCRSGDDQNAATAAAVDSTTVAEADPRLDFTVIPGQRVGLVKLNSATEADVLQAYGDLAQRDSIHLGEGVFEPGVVLFKGSRNQVDLYWDPAMGRFRPSFVSIYDDGGETNWKTAGGITLGTTLADLNRLNGRPFELYGFGWDFGGYVSDWKSGQLAGKGLSIRLELATDAQVPMEFLGDGVVLGSDNPSLLSAGPTVAELTLLGADPIKLLQGRWHSTTDASYEIVFEGERMHHRNNGSLTLASTVEPDPGCRSPVCAATGTAPEGFCFLERDDFGAQCNLLINMTPGRLEYAAIGAAGASLAFERADEQQVSDG